ncbi:hypothetical protein HID58_066485 [Brassica napus]|uniref:Uncharacterized protein n=1 Tax=Brassica napus TaxID=3708 RepID=A0ABQ7ZFV7_BRANA|nr:hypothetical protein HID58_066485 [Brassica napus]
MRKSKSFERFSGHSIETKTKAHLSEHLGLNQLWLWSGRSFFQRRKRRLLTRKSNF